MRFEKCSAELGKARTFVAIFNGDVSSLLKVFGGSQLYHGKLTNYAIFVDPIADETILLVTAPEEKKIGGYKVTLQREYNATPVPSKATWIGTFSRRLQRKLGCGDILTTREDVASAAEKGDKCELLAIMPRASNIIGPKKYHLLPALYDVFEGKPLAIRDCEHDFFEEGSSYARTGPCALGPEEISKDARLNKHTWPYTRCRKCKLTLCQSCANGCDEELSRDRELLQAIHDVEGTHSWESNNKAMCTICHKTPALVCPCGSHRCLACVHDAQDSHDFKPSETLKCQFCLNDYTLICECGPGIKCTACTENPALVCDCGAQMPCEQKCSRPFVPMDIKLIICAFRSSESYNPFYVVDNPNTRFDEKIAGIRQEVGDSATLTELCTTYMELFCGKIQDPKRQQKDCLILWSMYTGINLGKHMTQIMPLSLQVDFQRVWDPSALDICQECEKRFEKGSSRLFCSRKCERAAFKASCRKCKKPADYTEDGQPMCNNSCNIGKEILVPQMMCKGKSDGDKGVKRGAELLNMVNRCVGFTEVKDPNHEPASKRRRS